MKSYPGRAARARARASRRVLEGGTKLDSAFLQRVAERERVHRDVVHALATSLDERRVLDLALRQACRVLEAPYGRVWLRELDDSLVVAAVQGPIRRGQIGDRISPVSIPGLVAESEVLVSLPDATAHPRWQDPELAQATDLRAYLGAPLRRAGERLGALEVMRPGDRAFTSEDGQVLCGLASAAAVAVSNARVLSRERAARSAADRQSGLLSAVLEHIEDAVIVAEPDGRIVLANRAAATLWGVPGDQLVGMLVNSGTRSVCDLQGSPLLPQDRPFERALRGFEGPSEIVLVTPQGRERQVRVFPRALRSPSGEIDALVFVVRDLTEVRAAEWQKEILARTEKLRAMGQMAGGVAHDLNQSLGLIAGYADLALRGLEGESVEPQRLKEMLGTVSRAALDGAATVKRLLTFARLQPEAPAQWVDLGALIRDVTQLTAPRWRNVMHTGGSPVSLVVETEGDLTIAGQPAALREALTNLIFNAVDALPGGGTLTLRGRREGDDVIVEVADTGTGMPPHVQGRIFEPFFTTKGAHGTGLGLAQVFGAVQQHGGRIDVRTAPGQGTTFTLSFPVTSDVEVPQPVQLAPAPAPATGGLRILAVDDEPSLAQLARQMLRLLGHEVEAVHSGEEALERLAGTHFDAVLSDLGLGDGMNGWELARQVRVRWPGVRFMLATGWGAAIDPTQAAAEGVEAVVAKPYRLADLRRLIAGAQSSGA